MILNDLNDDVLTAIFEKCSLDDVVRLYDVCKRFREIITRHVIAKKCRKLLIVGTSSPNAEIVTR